MRIALPPVIAAEAVATRDAAAAIVTLAGETMGTTWRILFAASLGVDVARLHAGIVARLDGLVAEMSHWAPESMLCRFNRAAAGSWTSLPPDFARVIAAALGIAEASGGAFDPAIGRLVDLWGYGPPGPAATPDAAAIARAAAVSGWRRLAFDPGMRRLRQPGGLSLDLSGIAKGHAVDALAGMLDAAGIRHHLVEVGGELRGSGVRPDGEPWWVDLEVPAGCAVAPLRVALHGLSVATSGTYRRGDHNLDPRTGYPADRCIVSASVIHSSAMTADAWATVLAVLPADKGIAMAYRKGFAARIIAREDDQVSEYVSIALATMLDDLSDPQTLATARSDH